MNINSATAADLASVKALLRESQLPYVDLTEAHMADFILARDADGALKGCIGLERYGTAGLLRSLAVDPSMRGAGVGQLLLTRLLAHRRYRPAAGVSADHHRRGVLYLARIYPLLTNQCARRHSAQRGVRISLPGIGHLSFP
ncbi:MAG: GNAT family N-acetyltransferase [Hydrogenophaga sp.]|uniref:GNAT family N-acetyltransferase n=1 Tax=Hydrogenophaga sp. TaxID=1904254 RepID=UPI0040365312